MEKESEGRDVEIRNFLRDTRTVQEANEARSFIRDR